MELIRHGALSRVVETRPTTGKFAVIANGDQSRPRDFRAIARARAAQSDAVAIAQAPAMWRAYFHEARAKLTGLSARLQGHRPHRSFQRRARRSGEGLRQAIPTLGLAGA